MIIDHLCYTYERGTSLEIKALDDINLVINEGEFIGLIGHTGSGKSTLVQHLNGLIRPTSGHIYYEGKDIYDKSYPIKELRRQVGLVFQYPEHQLFETTVLEDVCYGPINQGLSRKEAELRAYDALMQVGIDRENIYQSPFELSGGQKRRVAIAGVLAMNPKLLVLDEPTAGLDPRGREEILDQIMKLRDESGIAVVLVSHSMEEVAKYVDRIVVMQHGAIMYDDIPSEIFCKVKELEEIGLAAPSITYILKRLEDVGYNVDSRILDIEEAKRSILDAIGSNINL